MLSHHCTHMLEGNDTLTAPMTGSLETKGSNVIRTRPLTCNF